MAEMNWTLPPEIENALTEFYTGPKPDQSFTSSLEMELRRRFDDIPETPIRRWFSGKNPMRVIRLRPVFMILIAILALILISGVVYAIGRLTGFIPGFGFTSGEAYILDAPVEQIQNGISIKVENAVLDENGFWAELSLSGAQSKDVFPQVYILSPSGEKIQAGHRSVISFQSGAWHATYVFPKLNSPSEPVKLLLENIGGQTIQVNLALRPTRNNEVMPMLPDGTLPVIGETRDGMALALESVAMSRDRTVLQVSLRFDNPNVSLAEPWDVTMKDDQGHIYSLIDITPITMDIGQTRIYQTAPMQGNENLILDVAGFPLAENLSALMDVSANPATFMFDPGNNPQIGHTWTLDKTLQAGQFAVHLANVYMASSTELIFEFESTANPTGVMLWSPLAGGASGGEPVQNGNFMASISFTQIPNEPFEIQIRSVYYTISGPWQMVWQVPPVSVLDFP